ncbi:hypothetical protein ACA910_008720 [Epithemia clementina (nom. ined.)]
MGPDDAPPDGQTDDQEVEDEEENEVGVDHLDNSDKDDGFEPAAISAESEVSNEEDEAHDDETNMALNEDEAEVASDEEVNIHAEAPETGHNLRLQRAGGRYYDHLYGNDYEVAKRSKMFFTT